jgi:hypothetical protein
MPSFSLPSRRLALAVLASVALGCAGQVQVEKDPGQGGASASGAAGGAGGQGGAAAAACTNGDYQACEDCGYQFCQQGGWGGCDSSGCTYSVASTPLVLVFDDGPVTFQASSTAGFDVTGFASVVTDWPTSATPWLALDRDGDGRIGDGGELFGSATVLSSGRIAANGFEALRELDSNGDGWITAADTAWPRLRLWADRDGDRVSSPGELEPVATRIEGIELADTSARRCDARGNCEVERARMLYRDASGAPRTGSVVDVHLRFQ